ncbi:hypothetical protein BBKW_0514 [Bifidobacterium catenulatum subsp. kashiwanohense JCM 15439 = DSM 21854]|nr:hypothetical protein BBKW_0514 [Bifidobacterium catenulatum subsp. kashiwanohense JCM 15439 = DSM 21854]
MIVYWLPMDDFVVFDFEKLAFITCNDLKRDLRWCLHRSSSAYAA